MADHGFDEMFRRFHETVVSEVRPGGLDDARIRARHRRRRRSGVLAALAVVALIIPIGAYAATLRGADETTGSDLPGPSGAPNGANLVLVPVPGTTSGYPSGFPREYPSPSFSSGGPFSPTPQADPQRTNRGSVGFCPPPLGKTPPGGLTAHDLCFGTLDVPAWPDGNHTCPTGRVTFDAGVAWSGVDAETLGLPQGSDHLDVFYTDVDHDGAIDTVIQVDCNMADTEILVLQPAAGGGIHTFAEVTATGDSGQYYRVAVTKTGQVQVETAAGWLTYSWNGSGFAAQTGIPGPSPLPTMSSSP